MGRKTRWSTRLTIILVISCIFYMGWHLKKAIQVYKETANTQPQVLDYSENGYNIKR